MNDATSQWYPIEHFTGQDYTPYLIWDKAAKQAAVALRQRSGAWFIHDSYGFNEDGEIPRSDISHWAEIKDPS